MTVMVLTQLAYITANARHSFLLIRSVYHIYIKDNALYKMSVFCEKSEFAG